MTRIYLIASSDVQPRLDSLPRLDARNPRLHVRELLRVDADAPHQTRPREGLDVCEAVAPGEILVLREMRVEDAVQTLRLVDVPLDRVWAARDALCG